MPTTATAARFRTKWAIMPDRRAMTFARRTAVGPPPTYATSFYLTNCWHRHFTTQPHPGNPGVYVVETCKIYVPRSPNEDIDPAADRPMPGDRIGDTIGTPEPATGSPFNWVANIFATTIPSWVNQLFGYDDSTVTIPYTNTVWTVQECTDVGALGTWELDCVSPKIVNAGSVSVKFQSPNETISGSGQRVVTGWADISTVSVWVQQTQTQADDVLGCRTFLRNATVYTSSYPTIDAQTTVLEVATNRRYTITAYRPARSLTDLNEYDLELIP